MESNYSKATGNDRNCFQQFFFKVRDDVDLPVPDYYVDFFVVQKDGTPNESLTVDFDEYFKASFYPHSVDPSHRVMLVDCSKLNEFDQLLQQHGAKLMIEINGKNSCSDIKYLSQRFEVYDPDEDYEIYFLHPNTTTLVDIILNRDQSNRMLQLKDANLELIERVSRLTSDKPKLYGGRAELIRENPSK